MKEINKAVVHWLKDEGAIFADDNLIVAEKAFFVNSVVRWYKRQAKDGTMTDPQIDNCILALKRFLEGTLDLYWDNGVIKVQKNPPKRSGEQKQ